MITQRPINKEYAFFYDRWILVSGLALLIVGLLMVASASMVISDRQFGYPFYYLIRQFVYCLLGIGLAWGATRIPMSFWERYSGQLFLLSVLLLLLVLVPGIGRVVNGSRRWIYLGPISLQVSEFAKFCSILYLAHYLQRFSKSVETELAGFIKPMVVLGILDGLLLLEPDFGAAVVLTTTFLALLFIARAKLWPFILMLLTAGSAFAALAFLSPYRLERLMTFLNPWQVQFGSGYQLTQSLIAFGRGGVFGVGLGNSVQKLFYLPEAHTDFVFAVLSEELGLIGELLLIGLFVTLISRFMWLARLALRANFKFDAYLVFGVGFWIGIQALVNMGVNAGLLPTKGLTLPLVSYGGSSMLVNCMVLGVMLRLSYELFTHGDIDE